MKKYFTLYLLILSMHLANAQSITGTWEGDLGGDEFLQVNIIQVKNNVCGYSWDYMYDDKTSFCKAYFNGNYVASTKTVYFSGYSFMQNSGGHIFIQLKASITTENGRAALKGYCRTAPSLLSPGGYPMEVLLFKVSDKPTIITQPMRDCENEYKKEQKLKALANKPQPKPKPSITKPVPTKPIVPKPVVPKPATPKPILPKPTITKPIAPKPILPKPSKPIISKTDTVIAIKPTIEKPIPVITPPQIINGRKNKEQSRIQLTDRKVTLELYDNGDVDGDMVSIYYNGKKIIDNKKLSTQPITLNLELDENTNLHSIVMFAENLGAIPPNTALIIVTTPTKKRYELSSSATLQQNAELIFEYKGK